MIVRLEVGAEGRRAAADLCQLRPGNGGGSPRPVPPSTNQRIGDLGSRRVPFPLSPRVRLLSGGQRRLDVHEWLTRVHGAAFGPRSFSCCRSSARSRLTAAASRLRALPPGVTLPVPATGSAVPALSTASQPSRPRPPRQVARSRPARWPPTSTCQARVSAASPARTSSYRPSPMIPRLNSRAAHRLPHPLPAPRGRPAPPHETTPAGFLALRPCA